ncbi:hypothetical protein [Thermococcus sp.]
MNPLKLWVTFAVAYLALAVTGKLVYPEYFGRVEVGALLYAILFMGCVLYGFLRGRSLPSTMYLFLSILLLVPLGLNYLISGALVMVTVYVIFRTGLERKAALIAVVVSIALVSVVALFKGFPIFKPELRYTWVSVPYLIAGDVLAIVLSIQPSPVFLVIGLVIATLGASRTVALAVFAAYLFRLSFEGKLRWEQLKDNRSTTIIILLLIVGVFFARYAVTISENPHWKLGFLGTQLYRLGSTYSVYEKLFEMGMPLGRHVLLFTPDPTGYVGKLFGKDVGYTYTIFGQPAYDFGILGLGEGILLGMALKEASSSKVFGTFSFVVATLMLEIGIEAPFLAAILYSSYLGRRGLG